MISYELAKKLKEAGFPQKEDGLKILPEEKFLMFAPSIMWPALKEANPNIISREEATDLYVYCPSLEELIEACGDCLSHMKKWNGHWWAVSHCGHKEHEPDGNNLEETGSTPTEAVAKLWLALNNK